MKAACVFAGPARIFESQDAAVDGILDGKVKAGDVVVIRYEGPARRPRHAGNALPDQLPQIEGARQSLRARHRRTLLRRHFGPVDRPRLARSGRRRAHRACRGWRPDRDRHSGPSHPLGRRRGCAGSAARGDEPRATTRGSRRRASARYRQLSRPMQRSRPALRRALCAMPRSSRGSKTLQLRYPINRR